MMAIHPRFGKDPRFEISPLGVAMLEQLVEEMEAKSKKKLDSVRTRGRENQDKGMYQSEDQGARQVLNRK